MNEKELTGALEAILFAAGDSMEEERLCAVLGVDTETFRAAAGRLEEELRDRSRGVRLVQMENRWQLVTAPEWSELVVRALEKRRTARLSPAAMEVLSIVAYYQPVTRAYVDQVRGVDSAYTVGLLLERELIEEAGRLAVPGRPTLFRTTKNFLRSFGLTNLEELPELPDEDRHVVTAFLSRCGVEEKDGVLVPVEETVPGSWVAPSAQWAMAYALGAFLKPNLHLSNPGVMTGLFPAFWNMYNTLPHPELKRKVEQEPEDAKPSRRRVIAHGVYGELPPETASGDDF